MKPSRVVARAAVGRHVQGVPQPPRQRAVYLLFYVSLITFLKHSRFVELVSQSSRCTVRPAGQMQ